ncbi:MAG: site-specific integrase [Oscillospiraceae bacterium]|nr:site-specific integrase [Oscillospiraceae bacterium]
MANKKNTRAPFGSGTIRQRSDGRWEARVTTHYDSGTGKQMRRSVYGDTQADVRQKLTALTKDVDDGTYIEPSKLTVEQWLDIWVATYLGAIKPNTADKYASICKTHLKPSLGSSPLKSLSAHTIQSLYNELQKGDGIKKGLSPKTVKNIHGVLHKSFQQAVKLDYIRVNPCAAVELPRIVRKEIAPLNEDQMAAFLDAIQGHRWEMLYTVALFTGLRQGELLGLDWQSVDFERGTIHVSKQLQRNRSTGIYELVATKNNKGRIITPAPSILQILKDQRRNQLQWKFRAGEAWNDTQLVFTDELGNHLSAQTVYLHCKKIAAGIGLPNFRFHDLRHSYAVAALSSGDDIKTLQETLGHHTISFTLDTYAHVTEKMKKESAARMESFYRSIKNAV